MEIAKAIVFLLEKTKLWLKVLELASVAALLAGKLKYEGKKVCAVISGGNIDISQLERMTTKFKYLMEEDELKFHVEDKSEELKILKVLADNKATLSLKQSDKYNCI